MINPKQAARQLYYECGMESPFDLSLEDIIFGRGAIIKKDVIFGAEGRILFKNKSAIITINSEINYYPRMRFIMAHELGHYEMHKDDLKIYSDNDSTLNEWFKKGSQESEANQFAAELLMPEILFRSLCSFNGFNLHDIVVLSDYFKTSLISTSIRFADLNIYPICIYYCVDGIVKWFHPSNDFPYWSKELTRLKVPSGSVAAEFFDDGTTYETNDIQEVEAFEWLDDKKIDKSSLINEHCFTSIKYNSAISIVWQD